MNGLTKFDQDLRKSHRKKKLNSSVICLSESKQS